jgi:hypothetical protein
VPVSNLNANGVCRCCQLWGITWKLLIKSKKN